MYKYDFTEQDRMILNSYQTVIKGIALIMGPNCEVTLHSMEDMEHSVIAIENSFVTGRKVGSAMIPLIRDRLVEADDGYHMDHTDDDIIGIFYNYNQEGHPLKSLVVLIRNPLQAIIGCIEIHIDVAMPLYEFVKNFLPSVNGGMMDEVNEHVPSDVDQLIYTSLSSALSKANALKEISSSERNRIIVKELNEKGIFNIRGAVETIAKQLGTSRYTIYNYLRDIKY